MTLQILNGRLNRKQFAFGFLLVLLLAVIFVLSTTFFPVLEEYFLVYVALIWAFGYFLVIRRLQDLGYSGLNVVIIFVLERAANRLTDSGTDILQLIGFFIGLSIFYFLFLRKGDLQENKYGPPNQYKNVFCAVFNKN